MVETLVFEAPTPLTEHSEREFGFPDTTNGDDTDCPEEWVFDLVDLNSKTSSSGPGWPYKDG